MLLSATDQPIVHAQALVTAEALSKAGLNVELQANDWGTLITRRASKEPVDKGGWNIFHTWTVGARHACRRRSTSRCAAMATRPGSAGRPTRKIEELIDAWFKAPDLAGAEEARRRDPGRGLHNYIPYVPTGQFVIPTAYRKNLDGIIIAPVVFLWNVEKK